MNRGDNILAASGLRYGFAGRPDFLGPIDLCAEAGEILGLIGPNGAGKTTLLRLLAGIVRPHGGEVRLGDRRLDRLAPRERARSIAFVPQRPPSDLTARAFDVVMMGRYPHHGRGLFESDRDVVICREAMALAGVEVMADRPVNTLSGGETQRVHLAAALAQAPAMLLLDEATSALDLYHQFSVFEMLGRLTRERRLGVVVVTHDLNLAGRYCGRVALLDQGSMVACGSPEAVLIDAVLGPVYGVRFGVHRFEPDERPWIIPRRLASEVCLAEGDGHS